MCTWGWLQGSPRRNPIRKSRSAPALRHPGVISSAIDVVEYDSRIQNAVEYLLRNTVIVKTLEEAIQIARAEEHFPRLVTLDGEVVFPAGAVTGGRTRHESRGLLGRSAEIAELEGHVQAAETELSDLTKERETLLRVIEEQKEALEPIPRSLQNRR